MDCAHRSGICVGEPNKNMVSCETSSDSLDGLDRNASMTEQGPGGCPGPALSLTP